MSAFDTQIQEAYPFRDYAPANHPAVLLKERLNAAKIRARHLLPEPEHE